MSYNYPVHCQKSEWMNEIQVLRQITCWLRDQLIPISCDGKWSKIRFEFTRTFRTSINLIIVYCGGHIQGEDNKQNHKAYYLQTVIWSSFIFICYAIFNSGISHHAVVSLEFIINTLIYQMTVSDPIVQTLFKCIRIYWHFFIHWFEFIQVIMCSCLRIILCEQIFTPINAEPALQVIMPEWSFFITREFLDCFEE